MAMTLIDKTLIAAKKTQPDLWHRTEQVARIIDPAAFMEDWVITPEERAELFRSRLKLMQSNALCKAQEILRFLGVNTDADWHSILSELNKTT